MQRDLADQQEGIVEPRPQRSPLRYYGSGWQRALWIVSHRPAHNIYCGPCFGSGAVLLRKPPAKLAIVNDLDGRVVNFFETLCRQPDDLLHAINLTQWHEAAFKRMLIPAAEPPEDALRFFLACWARLKGGAMPGPSDFRWQKALTRRLVPSYSEKYCGVKETQPSQ